MFKAFQVRQAAGRGWCEERGLPPGRYMVDPTSAEPLPADLFSRVDPAIVMAEVDRLDQAGNGSILELTPAELEVLRGIGGPALVTQVQRDFNLVAAPEDHLVMQ